MTRVFVLFCLFLSSLLALTVTERVESIISGNHVAVFSKSYCPYCRAAKQLLNSLTNDVYIVELDQDCKQFSLFFSNENSIFFPILAEGNEIQSYLLQKTGQRTVPNIFIGQAHIGGNDKVQQLHRQGALTSLLTVPAGGKEEL
jgi:glutaredoxin 3